MSVGLDSVLRQAYRRLMANGTDSIRRRPLILQLARPQKPSRAQATKYDGDRDELLVREAGRWVPAVDSAVGGLRTKKADVETGEDQKDRW